MRTTWVLPLTKRRSPTLIYSSIFLCIRSQFLSKILSRSVGFEWGIENFWVNKTQSIWQAPCWTILGSQLLTFHWFPSHPCNRSPGQMNVSGAYKIWINWFHKMIQFELSLGPISHGQSEQIHWASCWWLIAWQRTLHTSKWWVTPSIVVYRGLALMFANRDTNICTPVSHGWRLWKLTARPAIQAA